MSWILFDEQFNMVTGSSGAEQVGADNSLTVHQHDNLPVTKNGFLYIYALPSEAPIGTFSMQAHYDNDIVSPSMRLGGVDVFVNFTK